MQWIIDLLIDKLKKDKSKEWQPEPLWIEDEYPELDNKEKEPQKPEKTVIVIDL